MGFYDKLKELEDEVVTLLADATTEALGAVAGGSIQKGTRLLTQYASLNRFPYIEVAWLEETFEASTQRAEHTVELQVAAMVKSSKPKEGLERSKQLFGECYDIIWANPTLKCQAEILPDGRTDVMPPVVIGRTQNWIYGVIGTFNYHLRF